MRRLTFSRLLLVIALVPALAMAVFASRLTWESWLRYSDLTQASSLLRLAVATSRLSGIGIPGLGGGVRDYLAGGNVAKLATARNTVDTLYSALREAAAANQIKDQDIDQHLRIFEEKMQQLVALRSKVDDRTLSVNEVAAILAPITGNGIDLVGRIGAMASDAVLARRILALYTTLQFNEGTLMQRSFVQRALQEGQLPPPAFALMARALTLQSTFGKLFDDYAPADVLRQYRAFADRSGKTIEKLQGIALANSGKPADAADVKQWVDINVEQTSLFGKLVSNSADLISAEAESMMAGAWRDILIYLGITLITIGVVCALTHLVLRTVRGLLDGLSHTMNEMREGHYDLTVPSVERKDEIGVMARATESFRENMVRMRALEAEQKETEARLAAERRAAEEREAADRKAAEERQELAAKEAMHQVVKEFQQAIGSVIDVVASAATELEASAGTLTSAADATQQRANTVAAASEEATANVQSVASSTEQLTASVNEISKQVQASSDIARHAVDQAEKTDVRVTELSQAASRIGDVVKLITAIAEQTNLLALNATIEAARAGEAGRGFAVVAQEVKALASQTAKATGEIGSQISSMQAATRDSVAAIKEIANTIGKIAEISGAIAAAVEEQGAATQEIAKNVEQAAKGTTDVSANITEVSHYASETGAASTQMLSSAQSLSQQGNHLKTEMERFLHTIRSGIGDRRKFDDPSYRGPERRKDLVAGKTAAA